jgi:hypothetical protein
MLSIDTIAQDSRHLIAAKLNDETAHSSRAIFWQLLPAIRSPAKLVRSQDRHFMVQRTF